MSINIQTEKNINLTSQQIYDICDFATQAAYDDGFMNSYIFERALYVFLAIQLFEDENIKELAAQNMNDAWDYIVNEYIDKLTEEYAVQCNYIAAIGEKWFEDYSLYSHSARGLLNSIQAFTGNMFETVTQDFQSLNNGSDVKEVLEIANKWGMNNKIVDSESLFDNE